MDDLAEADHPELSMNTHCPPCFVGGAVAGGTLVGGAYAVGKLT